MFNPIFSLLRQQKMILHHTQKQYPRKIVPIRGLEKCAIIKNVTDRSRESISFILETYNMTNSGLESLENRRHRRKILLFDDLFFAKYNTKIQNCHRIRIMQ